MAAFENRILDINFTAGEDLSGKQYHAVALAGDTLVLAKENQGQFILQNAPQAGQQAVIRLYGVTFAKSAAPIAVGALVANDKNGEFITAIPGMAAIALAVSASSVAGEIFSVIPFGVPPITL